MPEILLPERLEFVQVPHPRGGMRKVLIEESFVALARANLTKKEMRERYPDLTYQSWWLARKVYGEKYKEVLRLQVLNNYSRSARNRPKPPSRQPAVQLDESVLRALSEEGRSVPEIARQMGTTEFFVKRNLLWYGMGTDAKLPHRLQPIDRADLERLEFLVPGFTEKAQRFYQDPLAYFLVLYEALVILIGLIWYIKDMAKTHDYYITTKKIPKNHICWSLNQYEARLSAALLSHGIEHVREFAFHKNSRADFLISGTKILVEVDGEFHLTVETKKRDEAKTQAARDLGYEVLRFTTKDVTDRLDFVLDQIATAAISELSQSPPLV